MAEPTHPSVSDAVNEERQWRIRTVLLVPKFAPSPEGGGLPETIEFQSRMPEQARLCDEMPLAIKKVQEGAYDELYGSNPQLEVVELVVEVGAAESQAAVEKFSPTLEALLDLLMFDMATPIGVGQMDLTDVTPPVAVGEERETLLFSSPPLHRHVMQVEMEAIQGRLIGELPATLEIDDSRTAAVLRWFVKALNTTLLHDQFIFLWIALEVLCDDSAIRVEGPYVGRCGHEIPNCPECGAETSRIERGATLRTYLVEFGLTEEQARDMWRMRQLMHGAIPFDSEKLINLGTLVQPLRSIVARGLKSRLGKGPEDAPLVAPRGLAIHPSMAAGGTGKIDERDLQPLIPGSTSS